MFTALFITCLAALFMPGSVTAGPTISRNVTVASDDWKLSRGWDGVVSSVESVGTILNGTAKAPTPLASSNIGGVFICDDINFGEPCAYAVYPLNVCVFMGTWDNIVSSLGPDPGTRVDAYLSADCTGASLPFANPGSGDLPSLGWNDQISSFVASAI